MERKNYLLQEKAGMEKTPAWCYYDNDPSNGEKFGKLYNWFAVNDPRGLAPLGWHIPSDIEWFELENYLHKSDAIEKMRDSSGWGNLRKGTNESGFTALPGGIRNDIGAFYFIGYSCSLWSSTEFSSDYAWDRSIGHYVDDIICRYSGDKKVGISVRCIKDK
jgi:uncharacterized protein (TIGR02145 family)